MMNLIFINLSNLLFCTHIFVVTGHVAVPVTQGKRSSTLSHVLQHQPVQVPHAAEIVQQASDDASDQQHIEHPKLVGWHWYLFLSLFP
jgi:hypothetical protein